MNYLLIVIDKLFETVALAESTTLTVNEDDPRTVGVPEIVPVLDPSANPFGNKPFDNVEV
jgi:hypothetical protein